MNSKKPIRKDRVLVAAAILVGIIVIPIIFFSGGGPPTETPPEQTPADVSKNQEEGTTSSEQASSSAPTIEELLDSATSSTDSAAETTETGQPETETQTKFQPQVIEYTVGSGETLEQIANRLRVSVDVLMSSNELVSMESVNVGDTLRVPVEGVLHRIKPDQTLTDITLSYGIPLGDLVSLNKITNPAMIYAGDRIVIPASADIPWKNVVRLSNGKVTRFSWPLLGEVIAGFGWQKRPDTGTRFHQDGVRIAAPAGSVVYACAAGTTRFLGENEEYGKYIVLSHADNFYSFYGNLSEILVYQGQFIEAGQPIANSGDEGIFDEAHLYFEIRNQEFPIDPQRYLP